jgi:ankyrin repeat protein
LKKKILSGDDIQTLNKEGMPPLACAARAGQISTLNLLLEAGANVNQRSFDRSTPLFYALAQPNVDVVEALLEKGANPHAGNQRGECPFYKAVECNHPSVSLFLERGVEPDDQSVPSGDGYLFAAARSGCLPVLDKLLEDGADVNQVSGTGVSALNYAIHYDHLDTVQFLIEHEADVNMGDRRQWTPLHLAVRNRNTALIPLLVDAGADLEVRDRDGHTPLMVAAQMGHLNDLKTLLDLGADVDAEDDEQMSAEQLARKAHQDEAGQIFENYRQNLRMRNRVSPLSF